MRISRVLKILGLFLMFFSLTMIPPVLISWFEHEYALIGFIAAMFITLICGLFLWLVFRSSDYNLKPRDGFLIVFLFWSVLSVFGALPFILSPLTHLSFTDAVFETMSGLTTTGATVITHLDDLPMSVLYYRQQLHFFGGMGIIVLAVAILPMLGVGGMQLYQAESVGPFKSAKLRPRMAATAKALWLLYTGFIIICAMLFWLLGMQPLDAIGESFSVLSTGGFATHDASFAYYHSTMIDCVAIFFMVLGATNFSLHYRFIVQKNFSVHWRDPEFKSYINFLLLITLVCFIVLVSANVYSHGRAVLNSIFTVVSISTTTGLVNSAFSTWPTFIPYLLMFVALIGGCGGSTSGGIKFVRALLVRQHCSNELTRLIHPQAVLMPKLGNQTLSTDILSSIWSFVALVVFIFVVLLLLLLADGLDLTTAFGALAACISATGASIGGVSSVYEHIPSFSKWVLLISMLLGRLEIFTVFVLLMPRYWKK